MKALIGMLAAAGLLIASPAMASEDLAAKHRCNNCHKMDKKLMAPSYKDIASKYKGQADAEAVLMDSTVHGSKGKWGASPMPPQPNSEGDAAAISKWILSL